MQLFGENGAHLGYRLQIKWDFVREMHTMDLAGPSTSRSRSRLLKVGSGNIQFGRRRRQWNKRKCKMCSRPCGMVKLAPAGRSRCSRQEKKGSLFLSVWLTMAMKKTKTKTNTNTSSFPNKGKQWLLEIDLFNNQDAMQWVQFTDIVLHPMIQSSVTRLIFLSASLMGKNTSNR